MKEFYVNVSNRDSLTYFPNNKGDNFKVHLRDPLDLPGDWSVSLCAFQYRKSESMKGTNVWIQSNLCRESIVGDISIPLLRRIPVQRVRNNVIVNEEFTQEHFIPIVHKNINYIHIWMYGDDYKKLQLGDTLVICTLHFKQTTPAIFT